MSIGNDMITIAEKLTDVYGSAFVRGQDRGYERGNREGYNRGFDEGNVHGYTAGREHARRECESRHYAASFLGSGNRRLSVPIPFKPHTIAVYSTHPYAGQVPNSFRGFIMDLRACGGQMASVIYCPSGDGIYSASVWPQGGIKFINYTNGIFSFELTANMYPEMIWPENVRYTVSAVQYPEESVAALLREQIRKLPDTVPSGSSGSLKYYRDFVLQYLSLPEWESLTNEKPNWTFILE